MKRTTQLSDGSISALSRVLIAATLVCACSGGSGDTEDGTESGSSSDSQTSEASSDSNSSTESSTGGTDSGETSETSETGETETGETSETGEPDEPHALGTILLGESHPAGGGSSTPFVSAGFQPNTEGATAEGCFENVGGCRISLVPECGDDGCDAGEYCTFDDACAPTCTKICDAQCGEGEVCYFPAPNNPGCKKIESFDAGALTFIDTPLPINLFPPYAFNGDNGSPFSPKGASSVKASGAANAGFEAFDAEFTGTDFVTTSPSLKDLSLSEVFGDGALPVKWQPGDGEVMVTVSVTADDFSSGVLQCEADDASGSLDVPRAAILAAIDDGSVAGMTVSVQRRRVDTTKGLTTKGTLTGVTVEPVGWVDIVTMSTESHTFVGCQPGELFCGDECIDVDYDDDNCGACGEVCPGDDTCEAGTCAGPESCDICEAESMDGGCKSEWSACESNSSCKNLKECVEGCNTNECVNGCAADFEEGISLLNEAYACLCEVACVDECGPLCS